MMPTENKKQLKIAFIVNEFPCISETFILNQITGLLKLGHDVRIFAYRKRINAQGDHSDISKFNLLARVRYFPQIPAGRLARLQKFLGILVRQIFNHPAWIFKCLNVRRYGIYESVNHLFLLEPFMDTNYDVLHCQYGTIGKKWVFIKDILKIRLVTSFRGYDLTRFIRENSASVYDDLFKRGDVFLPVCSYFAKKLQDLGCPKERIHVHCSGIDTVKFSFRERQMENTKVKIFTVGRLVEKKGMEYSIRAVAKLAHRHPAIQYTITGEGPLRSQLENLIQELQMEKHIHLTGPLPSEAINKLMDSSHIFILASVTAKSGDQEGIPVSLQEAMAAGLPVIATHHSGIPELVEDGKSGFLVPERDAESLATQCEYLISHPERCLEMGRAGRKFTEKYLEISKLNEKLVELYQKS